MSDAAPPLAGLTVVDLGQIYNAPYASMLLALAGADVIKVEAPGGESLRGRNVVKGAGADLPFYMVNSNKRSVTLNLKSARGRELLLEMVERASVIIENFRPGVMDRLSLGDKVLFERNRSLVVASSSGYGQEGLYRDLPAMDLTVQAMAGVMTSTGFPDAPPVKAGPAIVDFFAGIHLYGAIVTALYRQAKDGVGARLDVSMLDSVYPSLLSNVGMVVGAATPGPARTGNRHGGLAVSPYNVYATTDGHVAIITVTEEHWNGILRAMDRPDLLDDPRFSSRAARVAAMEEVDALVGAWCGSVPTDEVFARLRAQDVPAAPVRELSEVVVDAHLHDRGMLQDVEVPAVGRIPLMHSPLRFAGEPRVPLQVAPGLGEHNEEIFCGWLGHATEELEAWREDGVV